jgi:hypothetical protein
VAILNVRTRVKSNRRPAFLASKHIVTIELEVTALLDDRDDLR